MKDEPTKKNNSVWIVDETKCLSVYEVGKLKKNIINIKSIGLIENRFSLVRNWFVIGLGLNTGLRVSEMASLKHASLHIESDRSSITVVGKGNKKRSVWISSNFKKTCQNYLKLKCQFGYGVESDAPLLNNLKGKHISKRALQKFFKKIIEQAGLPTHYGIHCLRHTYATFLLEASGHNYRFVQKQLGHSSLRTTQVYASVLESAGRKAIEKLYK